MGSRKAIYTTLFLNKDRYFAGSKKLRTEILSHIQSTYGTSRKGLIRLTDHMKKASPGTAAQAKYF